jgi:hypothetical protein
MVSPDAVVFQRHPIITPAESVQIQPLGARNDAFDGGLRGDHHYFTASGGEWFEKLRKR